MRQFLFVCVFLYCLQSLANRSRVPPGFEQVVEDQELMSDVVFMGESIGLHKVKINTQSFVFLEPQTVYKRLEKAFSVKPEFTCAMQRYLAQSLERNDTKSCVAGRLVEGCGYIQSEKLAGIYNDNNASILLFANVRAKSKRRR